MQAATSLDGQGNLPRYFARVFAIAQRLERGRLDFVIPDGRRFRVEGARPGPAAELDIHDGELFARLIREGDLGFCEAYLDGGWTTPDLMAFMDLLHDGNDTVLDGYPAMRLAWAWETLRHWWRSNSRRQARKNIARHYDLGNDFYRLWLDDTMAYSCGLFPHPSVSLRNASRAKFDRVCQLLDLRAEDHMLDIGGGWGGFAMHAAQNFGCRVTTTTISQAQFDFARQRIAEAGLAGQITVLRQDYRDLEGQFDKLVSIEMIEAVGYRFLDDYFRQCGRLLRPDGSFVLQGILMPERGFQRYLNSVDFIQRYVFPGGMLPSPQVLKQLGETFGVPVIRERIFGEDYAKTLATWRNNFREAWPNLMPLGFDDRFRRLWEYYLAYCEAGFLSGNIDVRQVVFAKSG